MLGKLTTLTHKIAIQLHLVTAVQFTVSPSPETFGYTLVLKY